MNAFKKEANQKLKDGTLKLKEKKRNKLISEKALKNGIVELKSRREKSKSHLSPMNLKPSQQKNSFVIKNTSLTKRIKRDLDVLKSNIADSRRKNTC